MCVVVVGGGGKLLGVDHGVGGKILTSIKKVHFLSMIKIQLFPKFFKKRGTNTHF